LLKITIHEDSQPARIRIEGKLKGVWVKELEEAWRAVQRNHRRSLLDLSEVSFIDTAGCELLCLMYRNGTELLADQPFTRYLVDQIKAKMPRNS